MSFVSDLSMAVLHSRVSEDAFWCAMFIVEQGAMTADELADCAARDTDPAAMGPVLDRYSAKVGTEDGVKHGLLSNPDGRFHATALGHKYVQWMYKQWWG